MKNDTTEQLNVVVYHVPGNFVTAGLPVVQEDSLVAFDTDKIVFGCQVAVEIGSGNHYFFVFREAAGCFLHDREYFRKRFFQDHFHLVGDSLFNFIYFCPDGFTFFQFFIIDAFTEVFHLFPFIGYIVLNTLFDFICFCSQLIV